MDFPEKSAARRNRDGTTTDRPDFCDLCILLRRSILSICLYLHPSVVFLFSLGEIDSSGARVASGAADSRVPENDCVEGAGMTIKCWHLGQRIWRPAWRSLTRSRCEQCGQANLNSFMAMAPFIGFLLCLGRKVAEQLCKCSGRDTFHRVRVFSRSSFGGEPRVMATPGGFCKSKGNYEARTRNK